MKKRLLNLFVLAVVMSTTSAYAWNSAYECVSNDAKKTKLKITFLDSEIVKTHMSDSAIDRYYRVTDTSDELVEAMILGHKSGEKAHLVPVLKGTMNITLTQISPDPATASVKVGKVVTTYSCK
jgi:succinate dehydrogenase flavin-adding protein (antitoxin of CptAB toxin-antitoxin module)